MHGRCSPLDDAEAQDALATASSPRACPCGRWRSWSRSPPTRSRPRPAPPAAVTAPALADLADRLSDSFDTRVKVELGRRKGKIVVEFASVDDLERIVGADGAPHLATTPDRQVALRPRLTATPGLAGCIRPNVL